MYIKLKPTVIKPSGINKETLTYVKGGSDTLEKEVRGLIPTKRVKFLAQIRKAKANRHTLVVEGVSTTHIKDQNFFNPAK